VAEANDADETPKGRQVNEADLANEATEVDEAVANVADKAEAN
jgi:hypothetical protein